MAVTTLRIKVGEQWYTVEIGDLNQSPLEVTVEGETFYVEVEGLAPPATGARRGRTSQRQAVPPAAPASGRAAPSASSDKILRSPMPGRVISIMVRPGDRVAAGDEVCVVEAMKMEQSIRAVQAGVVKTIHVQPMDSVNASDPLIELE